MIGKRRRNWSLRHAMSNIEGQKRIWTKQSPENITFIGMEYSNPKEKENVH